MLFHRLAIRLERRRKMNDYRRIRSEAEALSEADLDDMGIKRAQLGTLARKLALY